MKLSPQQHARLSTRQANGHRMRRVLPCGMEVPCRRSALIRVVMVPRMLGLPFGYQTLRRLVAAGFVDATFNDDGVEICLDSLQAHLLAASDPDFWTPTRKARWRAVRRAGWKELTKSIN